MHVHTHNAHTHALPHTLPSRTHPNSQPLIKHTIQNSKPPVLTVYYEMCWEFWKYLLGCLGTTFINDIKGINIPLFHYSIPKLIQFILSVMVANLPPFITCNTLKQTANKAKPIPSQSQVIQKRDNTLPLLLMPGGISIQTDWHGSLLRRQSGCADCHGSSLRRQSRSTDWHSS